MCVFIIDIQELYSDRFNDKMLNWVFYLIFLVCPENLFEFESNLVREWGSLGKYVH